MHMIRAAALTATAWALPLHGATLPAATGACPAIALAGADAAAVRVPSAPNAWGGPGTGSEGTLSNRVVAYSIDASLDPVKHTIVGKQKRTWHNRSAPPVCSMYLHMYLNGFEGAGSTFMTEQRASESGFRSNVETKGNEYGFIRLDRGELLRGGMANTGRCCACCCGRRSRLASPCW